MQIAKRFSERFRK